MSALLRDGRVDDRALALGELEGRAHRLERQEDVGEEDRRVHAELERLERDLERELGRLADLEHRVLLAERAVLGHVAARLAHHPDGRAVHGLAAAGAKEPIVHREQRIACYTGCRRDVAPC